MSCDLLDIVSKYNKIAKKLSGCSVQVKDKTMFPFLAFCLSSSDASIDVVESAVDTLNHLAEYPQNINQMLATFGIFEAVKFVMKRDDLPECLERKVFQLHDKLSCKDLPALCTRSKTKVQPGCTKLTKLIKLHVFGLNDDHRKSLETAVVKIRGVVSVVVDVEHQRCTLLVSEYVTPIEIASVIKEKTELIAKLVSKNKTGKEILLSILDNPNNSCQEDWPLYLEEEESPVKGKSVSQMFLIKDKTADWLNSAVGFFQKSFYW